PPAPPSFRQSIDLRQILSGERLPGFFLALVDALPRIVRKSHRIVGDPQKSSGLRGQSRRPDPDVISSEPPSNENHQRESHQGSLARLPPARPNHRSKSKGQHRRFGKNRHSGQYAGQNPVSIQRLARG